MGTARVIRLSMMALGIVALLTAGSVTGLSAQRAQPVAVQIDSDDIGGVVTSTRGPEAGVWVIAETTEHTAGENGHREKNSFILC